MLVAVSYYVVVGSRYVTVGHITNCQTLVAALP